MNTSILAAKEEDKVDKVHKDEDSRVHEHKFFIRKAVSFY